MLAPDMQQRTIESLSWEIDRLRHQMARLKRELRETRGDNHRFGRLNTELEALIMKDSHNSSRTPSTDASRVKRTESLLAIWVNFQRRVEASSRCGLRI
jgi:septal ring factor EnvC (AmiA/AmiB activator)